MSFVTSRRSRRRHKIKPKIAESDASDDMDIIKISGLNNNNNNNNNDSNDDDTDLEIISGKNEEIKSSELTTERKKRKKRKLPPLLERINSKKKKQKLNDNNNENDSDNETDSDSDSDTSKKKKSKKKKKKKKVKIVKEKRLARYRSICNMPTKDRIYRARTQRLFMVNASNDDDVPIGRKYSILGSTGNLYTVKIGHLNTCTCPDFLKGNLCKHILFVMIKVLRVPYDSAYVYQRALLTNELEEIFGDAPQTHFGVLASQDVRNKFNKMYGKEENDDNDDHEIKQRPLDGECPVCMEDFEDTKGEPVVWCKAQCGQNVHTKCFKEWSDNCMRNDGKITCMYCRVDWLMDGQKKTKSNIAINEGYVNFANEQGIDIERDYDDREWWQRWY